MIAVVGLISIALLLCIILLVGGTAKSRNSAPQPKKGEIRHQNPWATGLN